MTESRQPGGTKHWDWYLQHPFWFIKHNAAFFRAYFFHLTMLIYDGSPSSSFFWGFTFIFCDCMMTNTVARRDCLQVRVSRDRPELWHHAEGVHPTWTPGQDHTVLAAVLRLLHIRRDVHVWHRLGRICHFQGLRSGALSPRSRRRFGAIVSEHATLSPFRTSSQDTSYWAPSSWSSITTE